MHRIVRLVTQSKVWMFSSLAAFLVAIRYCSLFRKQAIDNTFDFPVQVISTMRVHRGEVPFRGFETLYGPLGYYLSSAFLWLFRSQSPVIALHYLNLFCLAVFYAICCIRFSSIRVRRPILLLGGAALIIFSAKSLLPLSWYSLPMILPIVVATETIQHTVESPTRSFKNAFAWRCVTAALLAAEVFIRFNFSFYLAFAICVVYFCAIIVKNKQVAAAALQVMALAALFLSLFSLIFAVTGILIPFLIYMRIFIRGLPGRNLAWPYVIQWLAIWTAVTLAVATVHLITRMLRRPLDFSVVPYIVLFGCGAYAIPRFDPLHLVPFLAFSLLIVCDRGYAHSPGEDGGGLRRFIGFPELQLGVVFYFFYIAHYGLTTPRLMQHFVSSKHPVVASLSGLSPEPETEQNDVPLFVKEQEMLRRLDSLRRPGDEVFWMSTPRSCRSTFDICANLNLYLADGDIPRPSVWYFDVVTTLYPDMQERIIHDIEIEKTAWIGVEDDYVSNPVSSATTRSTELIDYVQQHYSPVFVTDIPNANRRYVIYARKGVPAL